MEYLIARLSGRMWNTVTSDSFVASFVKGMQLISGSAFTKVEHFFELTLCLRSNEFLLLHMVMTYGTYTFFLRYEELSRKVILTAS